MNEEDRCDYWYDCTLELQDDPDEVELLEYPTMSCQLEKDHDGPHQLKLDRDEEEETK